MHFVSVCSITALLGWVLGGASVLAGVNSPASDRLAAGEARVEVAAAGQVGPGSSQPVEKAGSEQNEHIGAEGVSESPIEVRADLAIYTLAVFLILLAVLWRFAWGPIREALDQRERSIAEQIEEARRSNAQAKELLSQYEQKLAAAQGEVEAILARARREADAVKDDIIRQAQHEADQMRKTAERQIDRAKQQALRELFDQAASLATELAGRIVRRTLKPEDQKELVEEAMRELASRN